MAQTRAAIEQWLDAQVGQSLDANCGDLRGQCVSLIKALNNFLGVPNPYAARGNATSYDNALISQGLATNADGWLRICVNHNFGNGYGHIWIDINGVANYEQNGARALYVTKNTRPISQAQQIVNYDRYVAADAPATNNNIAVRVQFSQTMNIRTAPSLSATITGQITAGCIGNFTNETATADGYFWRKGAITGGWVATANAARTVGFGTVI